MHHVFISYVRENLEEVEHLSRALRRQGISVWLDRDQIEPGRYWKDAVTAAIRQGAFFIACFSPEFQQRRRSFMNEELNLAIEELRLRPQASVWFIPVRLAECDVPPLLITAGRTLQDLQWLDYFSGKDEAVRRILAVTKQGSLDAASMDSPESLFDVRRSHYKAEKNFLAKQFAPLLFRRARQLFFAYGRPVTFFLDSGTTIFPFFECLAECALEARRGGDEVIMEKQISIVTNSIPGILWFLESARLNRHEADGHWPIPLEQLPGAPQGKYWAATGDKTIQALASLADEKRTIITLTTGSFVRIVHEPIPQPIPLVRGHVHGPVKREALRVSREAYVVAPLGKILAKATAEDVNALLKGDPSGYADVSLDGVGVRPKLVSTKRSSGDHLWGLTQYLLRMLSAPETIVHESFVKAALDEADHLLFEYKQAASPDDDFPDVRTRAPEFQRLFREFNEDASE